jgi:hypothetical protein
MKTYTVILSAILALLIMSCFKNHEPDCVFYNLSFDFQDEMGNSLASGIELSTYVMSSATNEITSGVLDSNTYQLDIEVHEECSNWDGSIYNTPARLGYTPTANRPYLTYEHGERTLLSNSFMWFIDDCPFEKIMTYKLKCPYVFGDSEVHEFVTYWNKPNDMKKFNKYAQCYLMEFDGAEITPIDRDGDGKEFIVTIKLEK